MIREETADVQSVVAEATQAAKPFAAACLERFPQQEHQRLSQHVVSAEVRFRVVRQQSRHIDRARRARVVPAGLGRASDRLVEEGNGVSAWVEDHERTSQKSTSDPAVRSSGPAHFQHSLPPAARRSPPFPTRSPEFSTV
jgi:hypothetical protein